MGVLVSTAAAGDLDALRVATLERWGPAPWLAWFGALERTLARIAAAPAAGRACDGFRPGLRSVPCGGHVVFYVDLGGGAVGVARVVHAGRNERALRWAAGAG